MHLRQTNAPKIFFPKNLITDRTRFRQSQAGARPSSLFFRSGHDDISFQPRFHSGCSAQTCTTDRIPGRVTPRRRAPISGAQMADADGDYQSESPRTLFVRSALRPSHASVPPASIPPASVGPCRLRSWGICGRVLIGPVARWLCGIYVFCDDEAERCCTLPICYVRVIGPRCARDAVASWAGGTAGG